MTEKKLTKSQARVFFMLHQQKQELTRAYQEIVEVEREQIEMVRKLHGLPEGPCLVRQEADGSLILAAAPEEEDIGDD
jgi:hypothetical protein